MSIIGKFFLSSTLVLMIAPNVLGQGNIVFRTLQRHEETNYESRLEKAGIDKLTARGLADLGYTDSTVSVLRSIGVDLSGLRIKRTAWSEQEKAALSDCIVIGSVSKIEHPQGNSPYQTIAYLSVDEFLRNDYHDRPTGIRVMIVSGPTRTMIPEDTLEVGEHVLLFLSASSLMRFAQVNHPEFFKEIINDPIIRYRIVGGGKYVVRAGTVVTRGMLKSLDQLREDIRAVVNVIPSAR